MDTDIKKVNQDKMDYISNLDENGLKDYILILIKKYYIAYLQDDNNKCSNIWEHIHDLRYMFIDDYPHLDVYINQCMVNTANSTIQKLLKKEFNLNKAFITDINITTGLSALAEAFARGDKLRIAKKDKINIKYLHDMVKIGEPIDENMFNVINEIYESFNTNELN